MSRLMPCLACGRHVRVTERECRFCGHISAVSLAPARFSAALLGLGLAACTSGVTPAQPDPASVDVAEPKPAPEPEPEPAPEPATPEPEPEPEQAGETGSDPAPAETDNVGTTDGSSAADEPVTQPRPIPKPKYGAPRPAMKYGGPPKPSPELP
jgi:hypothetical protein